MTTLTEPLRIQTASTIKSGMASRAGTLLLYPDRISHVASAAMGGAMLAGAVGMVVAGKLTRNRAAEKEAEGGKG